MDGDEWLPTDQKASKWEEEDDFRVLRIWGPNPKGIMMLQANVFQTVPRFLADYDFLCFPWNHHQPEVRGCIVFLFFLIETARGLLSSGGSPSKQNAATVTVPGRPNYFFRFVASSAHRTKRPVFIKYGPRIATNLQNPSKPTKKKVSARLLICSSAADGRCSVTRVTARSITHYKFYILYY